jgi:predicted double-glycine peptidase
MIWSLPTATFQLIEDGQERTAPEMGLPAQGLTNFAESLKKVLHKVDRRAMLLS